ncbi:liprin-beta-1 [Ahaetulla prasina]|uniref:liprin-beta-1 n=1 Tax=Ahaetulla prasina TaxID=499056 RepID=UPI00264A0373|nr:liprin-beta-1 [Ahaetulla prasina]
MTMMGDASEMLAAALEQMDGIIAGSKALEYSNGLFDCQSPTSPFMGSLRVLHLVEDLRGLLEMMEIDEKEGLRCQVPDSTAEILMEWLQNQMINGHLSANGDVYQERLTRLESDKESLVLQVSVLTDQVDAQGEKIRDLELCLEENREKLNSTEEMLQQELLSRTSLETQKLDLMAEVSNLKLKLTAVEKDRMDYEDRFGDADDLMQEVNDLRLKVGEMDRERLQYEKKLKSTKEELLSLKEKLEQKESEIKRLHEKLVLQVKEDIDINDKDDNCKKKLKDKNVEVQKMKTAVESLLAANEEKDRKIEELRQSLNRYKKVQDMVILAQGKKGKDDESEESGSPASVSSILLEPQNLSEAEKSPSSTPLSSSPNHEALRTTDSEENSIQLHTSVLQVSIPSFSQSFRRSEEQTERGNVPSKTESESESSEKQANSIQLHTSVLQVSIPSFSQSFRRSEEQTERGNVPSKTESESESSEKQAVVSIETQLSDTKIMKHLQASCIAPGIYRIFSALQKSSSLGNLKKDASEDKESRDKLEENKSPVENSKYVTLPCKSPGDEDAFGSRKARSSFGRGFFKIKSNKRTASAPNLDRSRSASAPILAETEKESPDHLDLAGFPPPSKGAEGGPLTPPSPDSKKKARGIKKLFGRLRRSQSTTFNPDDMTETEFKRGGTRATAGPRLGWSRDLGQSNNDLDMPFAKWRKEQVCSWLQDQGLGFYIGNGKHWILSGQTLLQASQSDLEKELGIKHPLHRKKLQLALQALGSEEENNYGKLDYNWVTRWLDDIGLPQYKTQFDEGKVDGRMLHYMTIDDLLSLKVLSVLHHLSIKRAIQVLRMNNFEPNCLRRRPSDENNITPSEVSQWTNHRVMEWLRSVDLAEYAPNLRGSGVHGGLMVLEPRFNVETLAQLLNIPPNKTLLRRHLATHFNLLVGSEAQQEKREAMEAPDYVLLTATAKVKPKKLAFSNFGNLRKKKQDDGGEEYVCPMDLGQVAGTGSKKGFKPGLENRVYDDDDLDRLEQMEDSEGTVRQIGAFSEGINNLTHMLKEDDMFRDLATRSPSASITDEDSNV